jgi:hypothetical protein
MKIIVSWYDEAKTIARMHHFEGWSWDEYALAAQTLYELIRTVQHPVDAIQTIETHKAGNVPPGNGIPMLRNLLQHHPPNLRSVTVVGDNFLAKQLVSIVNLTNITRGLTLNYCKSLEEALAIIEQLKAPKS